MLVMSRKKDDSIIINDDITITVVDIRPDKVRLGVEAPREVPVHRGEAYEVGAPPKSTANDDNKPQRKPQMCVVPRRKNESIIINDDITIIVVDIREDKVRLGIEVPKEVPCHRKEVYDAIQRMRTESSDGPKLD
jgi:carbon storage regulator